MDGEPGKVPDGQLLVLVLDVNSEQKVGLYTLKFIPSWFFKIYCRFFLAIPLKNS